MRHVPSRAEEVTGEPLRSGTTTGLFRAGTATLATGLVTAVLIRITVTTVEDALAATWAPDRAVAAVVLLAGTVAAAVLTFGCLLLTLGALARVAGRSSQWLEQAAARLTPAVVRRAVAVTVGAGLSLAGTTGVATAAELDLGWEVTTTSTAGSTVAEPAGPLVPSTGGPSGQSVGAPLVVRAEPSAAVTDRPPPSTATPAPSVQTPAATPATATTGRSAEPATVLVSPGDSLWSIAAAHLPPGASDAEIARTWPQWYRLNQDRIGADPDVIMPGQQLVAPGTGSSDAPEEQA